MSVINKMLQELDRRNATAGSEAEQPPQQVKLVHAGARGHEWFWRIVAALMLGALGWVGWVAYQLQPGPRLVTDEGLNAGQQAATGTVRQVPTPSRTPSHPAPVQQAPAAVVAPPAEVPVPAAPAPEKPATETLKLAQAIETPIPAPRAQPVPAAKPVPNPEPAQAAAPPPQPAAAKAAAPAAKALVDKRDRAKPASELAEAQFRRAGVLLNQGRVSEAEEQLVGALQADPLHGAARQAYVALLLEQQRTDAAQRVLRDALSFNAAHPTFALALARIHAEQRDYPGALEVMDRAGSVGRNADFMALRGAVLQRMQRHKDAVDAYEAAVRGAPQPGTTWVGFGISLEALGRKAEAANAYRRSLGAGALSGEVREYAEARIRALE